MNYIHSPMHRLVVAALALLMLVATLGTAGAQTPTVNRNDILYILPFVTNYPGGESAAISELRARLAPGGEGSYVRLGFARYIDVKFNDWTVDISNPVALRAQITGLADINAVVDMARTASNPFPVSLALLNAVKEVYDPVQTASEREDIRSMQWYADNTLARGWWSYSRYARKKYAVQQAYMREVAKEVARLMRDYPDTLVAASGDGEVELARPVQTALADQIYADYSPFTVAEFRDWIRHAGLYAPGGELAGQGCPPSWCSVDYGADPTPTTFNRDFATSFATWNLLHFDWSLSDQYLANDPHAIPLTTYLSGFSAAMAASTIPNGFDPPRAPRAGSRFWDLWVYFKQTLIQRYNIQFAKWMTTTPIPAAADPAVAADATFTIPRERWYSYQIPADMMFQCANDCASPNERWYSSMSTWWTADISPYGSFGVTAFTVDWIDPGFRLIARTLAYVAPKIAERNLRWGLIEWHPGLLKLDTGVSSDLSLFTAEMDLVKKYRPNLLQPFMWGLSKSEVMGTPFETALRQLITDVKDGRPPRLVIDPLPNGTMSTQPLTLTGWAADFNKSPGGGTGIDQVAVYRIPANGDAPVLVGTAAYGVARPTEATTYGAQYANSGFSLAIPALPVGPYVFEVRGHSTVTGTYNVTARLTVTLVDKIPFVGPVGGGGWSGTISGSNFIYNGVTYPIVNGMVNFPDCTTFTVQAGGNLGSNWFTTPNCTPGMTTTTLTWATPASVVAGTALSAAQLNASSGGVPGTFAYAPPLGTVMNTVGNRTLSVTFTPTDSANFTTATASVTLVVTAPVTPTITWANPTGVAAGTVLGATQLNATASVAGTFAYSPAAGTVLAAGTRTLSTTFTPTDTLNYTTATRSVTLVVAPPVTPVITWANPASVMAGTALGASQLNATANVAGTFAYTPAAGTVLSAGTQTLAVTFTPTDTISYTIATATATMTVMPPATPVITWPTPAPAPAGTTLGATQLNATANVPGTFVYSPAAGTVLATGTRTLSVTFTPTDALSYTTATASVTLVVAPPVMPVITWANPASVVAGTALGATQLHATANVAGTFVYTPAAGTVLAAGTQTLATFFTPTDTVSYTTATATVTIVVTAPAIPIITWPTPASVTAGTPLGATQLNATANVPGTFTYSPAAGAVLSVGTQTLAATFTPTDSTSYTTATKTVTLVVTAGGGGGPATPTVTWANPAAIVQGTALSAAQLNASSGGVAGSFVYTPPAGTVLPAGTHTLAATFNPSDPTRYTTVTKLATLVVTAPVTPTITWANPAAIVQGTALSAAQLNASSGGVAGSFVYTPAAGTVLPAGTNTLAVTFTPSDPANYTTATKLVTLVVVAPVTPTITWANPASVTAGTSLSATQLNATANVAGTFVYTPPAGTVLAVGTQTLATTFTPTDTTNYTTATKLVTMVVTRALITPTITWATPAAVTVATALSATQLNASAGGVAGTFAYAPPLGTVMNTIGSQTLSVTFTPTDGATYSTATKTVQLQVNAIPPFVGPANGGGWSGAISGQNLIYNGGTYAIVNGRVSFPDCTTFIVGPNGALMGGSPTPNCTPGSGSGGGGGGLITPTITWAPPAAITQGTALTGAQLTAAANVPGTFAYNPGLGAVLAAGNQTLSVTFTPTNGATYSSATATVTLVVTASSGGGGGSSFSGPPNGGWSGTISGQNLIYNNATYPIVNGRVNFPDCTTFIVGPNGSLMGGSPTPNCTPSGGGGGGGGLITPAITWATPAAITQGTALTGAQLNAASNVPGTFAYNPGLGAVLAAGNQTLSVTFTPNDVTAYTTATVRVTLVVTSSGGGGGSFSGPPNGGWSGTISGQTLIYNGGTYAIVNGRVNFPDCTTFIVGPNGALMGGSPTPNCTPSSGGGGGGGLITPMITWATPAAITQGTALTTAQLNAAANVPGTFAYSPGLGAVLAAGNQTLSVTFTPNDATAYTTATVTVTLVVTASGGGGGGTFVGPPNGGWSGTISGSNLIYNGRTFPIVNGRVNFPDCTTFIVAPNGALMGGAPTPGCTPGG